jgi:imidazolonepropionase-like amidohydrolase
MVVAAAAILATSTVMAARIPEPFTLDPNPSTYRPLPRKDTLIVGGIVLDGAGSRLDGADVLMRDGRIVAVGKGLDAQGAIVIDAHGRWVTPGIIDVHTHEGVYSQPQTSTDVEASDVAEISDPNAADTWVEHAVNPEDPAFAAALQSGVTTVQILPGSTPLFSGRSVIVKTVPAVTIQQMKFPGAAQALKMACGENPKSYFGGDKSRAPNSRQGEVAIVRTAFLNAQTYLQGWRDYESGNRKEPPARDLKLDTLAGVLTGQIPVHMHCYRASDMTAMLGVAQEFGFKIRAFHHATDAYKIIPQLELAGTCVAVWSDWWGFKIELLDAIRENAAIVDAAGGCVMMHSDSPTLGQRLAVEAGKAAGAARRIGIRLPPEHLIEWVTSTPAKVLGLADRIGTLAPGRNADVVVWSTNPMSIYSKADQVFIDGALAYDRSKPTREPAADFLLGRPAAKGLP